MQCVHCQAWNEEDERRCFRCGRRVHSSPLRPALETLPLMEAAVPSLEALQEGRSLQPEDAAPMPPGKAADSSQPWLFRNPSHQSKVVPIPTLTPRPRGGERKPRAQNTSRAQGNRAGSAPRRAGDPQQSLDFQFRAAQQNALGMEVEAVIYCDAPVALPVHRLIAFAVDASLMVIALSLFLGIFYLAGGRIFFSKQSASIFIGVAAAIVFLYRFLWCLGDGDTPGMCFAGLRLVDFDGRRPERERRLLRLLASVLSIVSAGLGLVWALVDEENLTWHDHISKTFPTPY